MIFGLRFTTKRELLMWAAMVEQRDKRIADLESKLAAQETWARAAVRHEQNRAEAAINMLLMKTQNMAIQRRPETPDLEEFERVQATIMNLFGSEQASKEDEEKAARQIAAMQERP